MRFISCEAMSFDCNRQKPSSCPSAGYNGNISIRIEKFDETDTQRAKIKKKYIHERLFTYDRCVRF